MNCVSIEESLRPRKSLGQNFLIDDNIARKIVRAAEIHAGDVVLEIGPGKGAITKHLIGQAERVIAVELDKRAVEVLRKKFERECAAHRLFIEQEDFLSVDLSMISRKFRKPLRVIGNIPYDITSPILFKVMEQREIVQDLVMLVQLEVGKRIVAKPCTKDYGILSVFCQFYGTPKLLFKVAPTAFSPKPKVFSVLLRLDFTCKPLYEVIDEKLFIALVRTTFGKRRKTLRNGLKYLKLNGLDVSKLEFNLGLRPEQLSVSDFVELSNEICRQLKAPSVERIV